LKDRSQLQQTSKELEKLIAENNLELQVIDWQKAAGFVGQMITVMQVVLYTFIIFVFAVATVIINNAMFMATMQRFTEIGTLRAIGASRSVIMGMFLCESVLLALIAGLLGLLAAVAGITYLGDVGIVAPKPEVHFVFGGERLHPYITLANVYLGVFVVFVVSIGATLYPAIYATRIPPVVAMSAKE
jgi:ABC-type antimicrobial peptide transport system permease subunit